MYGHLAASFHYTPTEIDQLTLWDANELMEYLADNPPAHIILAAVHLKRTPGKTSGAQKQTAHDLRGELARFGLGGPATAKLPEIYRNQES